MATAVFGEAQFVVASIAPKTAKGNPGLLDGIPVWASSNPAVADVQPSVDGLSCKVVAVAAGDAQISVTADVDLGEGVKDLTDTGNVTVTPGETVSLGISFGTPADQ